MTALKTQIVERIASAHPKSNKEALLERLTAILAEARALDVDEDVIAEQLESWYVQFPRRRHSWPSAETALGDLHNLLVGPRSRRAKTWHWLTTAANWAFDHYVAVASLLVAVATAFYSLAYARFYDSLELTPEQVGLTPTQILTHSVVGGVTLTALIAVGFYCVLVPILPVRDDPQAQNDRGNRADLLANALFTGFGALALLCLLVLAGAPLFPIVVLEGLIAAIFLASSFRAGLGRGHRPGLRPLRFSSERYLIVAVAIAIPVGLLVAGGTTFSAAGYLGWRVSEGLAVNDAKIMGVPFLGVRAAPALISWGAGSQPVVGMPSCVFYLGTSNGNDIFYDHRSRSTFHVPADEVAVELRSEMSTCEAPYNATRPSVRAGDDGALICSPGSWHSYMSPLFAYEWISEGIRLEDDDGDLARVFKTESELWPGRQIRCRVTATTSFGSDTAVSRISIVPDADENDR